MKDFKNNIKGMAAFYIRLYLKPISNQLKMNIMKTLLCATFLSLCLVTATPAMAQFNLNKAISGAAKVTKAVTLTDEQMADYVKEYIDWMDTHNEVCGPDNPYTIRLNRLTEID